MALSLQERTALIIKEQGIKQRDLAELTGATKGLVGQWLPRPKRAGPHTYCLRVEGDSMTAPYGKSYPAGCIIFVDPDKRSPVSGQRIIAKLKGSPDVTFKVFIQEAGKTFLKPLNPQYPAINEPFKVIGTVIGKWEDE